MTDCRTNSPPIVEAIHPHDKSTSILYAIFLKKSSIKRLTRWVIAGHNKSMARSFEETLGLFLKWILAIIGFFVLAFPFQLIWFLLFPFIKGQLKKRADKAGVAVNADIMFPINWYAGLAKRFIEGEI